MKKISKLLLILVIACTGIIACQKEEALPYYTTGTASVLSSSSANVAPAVADSDKVAVTLSWTSPQYATDAATVKYILEVDSSGRNFSKSLKWTFTGTRSKDFTAKELNAILLGFGFNFNVASAIDARVTSSYGNNNDVKVSNTLKITATAYKVPPKIAIPASATLFLVGDATQGGWNNPVPVPTQQFSRVDETTFMGVFDLNGDKQYLVLPVNGDWSQKYATPSNSVPGIADGGNFQFYTSGGDNFKSPATSGKYLITMDFQRGTFTCVPYNGPDLATNLFIVGNATPGGWNNPVPVPSQQFTRLNSCEFELSTLALTGGNEYLLLPENGNWGKKYAVEDNSIAGSDMTGPFKYYTSGGQNMKAPTVSGNYKINVNFATAKYKLTKL